MNPKTTKHQKNMPLKHKFSNFKKKKRHNKGKKNNIYESDTDSETNLEKKKGSQVKTIKKKLRKEFHNQSPLSHEVNIDSESDENMDSDLSDNSGNAGWADSIAKVLNTNKPQNKKNLVLSKAKKINLDKNSIGKNPFSFEVEGEITETVSNVSKVPERKKKKRKSGQELCVKPSPEDYEYEKSLKKVATQAVIQFFNAVEIQQKEIEIELEKAGPLDSRREAVYNNLDKRKFLQLLKKDNAKPEIETTTRGDFDKESQPSTSSAKGWSVLRSDFMTDKKFKDWDKEDTDSCNQSIEGDSDDDK